MTDPIPTKDYKLTHAAVAALWVLRHDHATDGPAFRSAKDVHLQIGWSSTASVRYGLALLDRYKLARFAGYDARQKNVMTWSFEPGAEKDAKAVIAAHHELLHAKVEAYRRSCGAAT